MIIPGALVALLTFPGVLLHEYAHAKACRVAGLKVYKIGFFRSSREVGYVLHEPPRAFGQALLVTLAPLFVNTFAEALVVLLGHMLRAHGPLHWFLAWLAVSFGMHALPSTVDAKSLWKYARSSWRREKKAILGFLIAPPLYIAALARVVWFDLIYALGVAYVLDTVLHPITGYYFAAFLRRR